MIILIALFNRLCRMLGQPHIVLDPMPHRQWFFWCVMEAPKNSKVRWQITRDGKIRFAGLDMTGDIDYTPEYFERVFRRLTKKMSTSGHDVVIEYVFIQETVATALWNAKFITRKDLAMARNSRGGIIFNKTIAGEDYRFIIKPDTTFPDYDITLRCHPETSARDRDTPSLQASIPRATAH